jgi:hypothetical protein
VKHCHAPWAEAVRAAREGRRAHRMGVRLGLAMRLPTLCRD